MQPTRSITTPTAPAGATSVRARAVRELDAAEVLRAAIERRRQVDRAEADLLALAVHLVDLHPVTEGVLEATWGLIDTSTRGVPERLAGVGTPAVADFAVEELGAALSMPYRTALSLVSDAVELCFRLPRLWELVQAGRLQVWRARQVAAATVQLSRQAVDFVDRHAAVLGVRNRVPDPAGLRDLVHEALLRFDPEVAEGREQAALEGRDVRFRHTESTGVSTMTATLDTLDALDLDATIGVLASEMHRLGDVSEVGERRAHALGMLAHPQRVLELFGTPSQEAPAGPGGDTVAHAAPGEGEPPPPPPCTCTCPWWTWPCSPAVGRISGTAATVEGFGPLTGRLATKWLRRVERVTVRPVLHVPDTRGSAPVTHTRVADGAPTTCAAGGGAPVDRHDPPAWMREVVMLRDGQCVFPGCRVDARRCDLDHITSYVDPDEGGPPGQTSVDNLACLCRRHHRLKTFTAWDYRRLPDGTYRWSNTHRLTLFTSPTPRTAPRNR